MNPLIATTALDRAESISFENLALAQRTLDQMRVTSQSGASSNELYQQTFQLLRSGGLEAEIPRLVVFGQQSMGKTTLLDFIIGGPIGFSSTTTGTRMPVVISIKPATTTEVRVKLEGQPVHLDLLPERMERLMKGVGDTITEREASLEIELPGATHAIFVDLPGIKDDSKSGAEMTRSVVKNYVQSNPNDLYILVKKASDDPANWPWSLREFILSPAPAGLGLSRHQTLVVGTRALEFITNERTEVDDLGTLQKRIEARTIRDKNKKPIPIHLLELFSLPLDMKKGGEGFEIRKKEMLTQVVAGQRKCNRLLKEFSLGALPADKAASLARCFDPAGLMQDLGAQFKRLLQDQMTSLSMRIETKIRTVQTEIQQIQKDLAVQGQLSVREAMRLFIRELLQVVTELIRGDYVIMRLSDSGDNFLKEFGGSLRDNLEEGQALACQLFPEKAQYDPAFLQNLQEWSKNVAIQRAETEKKCISNESIALLAQLKPESIPGDAAPPAPISEPQPFPVPHMFPGQMVSMHLNKSSKRASLLLGFVVGLTADGQRDSRLEVNFFYQQEAKRSARPGSRENEPPSLSLQGRAVASNRLQTVVPVGLMLTSPTAIAEQFEGLALYRRVLRDDGWLGLESVSLVSIENLSPHGPVAAVDPQVAHFLRLQSTTAVQYTGSAVVSVIDDQTFTVPLDELFVSEDAIQRAAIQGMTKYELKAGDDDQDVKIAGQLANTKLLNQLSLTYLGRWLKYHINRLEPDRKFSLNILMQMMRSVRHVIDKADWEPLVADLLQANVRGGLLSLARLASCAAGVALRRIVRAGLSETERKVREGLLSPGLLLLVQSPRFMEEISTGLEEFCKQKALMCSETMRDMIFEQTHAVHFEMIEDFFEGCRDFEREFLSAGDSQGSMDAVLEKVKSTLQARKERLGTADIYSRQDTSTGQTLASEDLIYEEVRIQFWVVKQLLSAPLTTKLYMHFVKDIKDRSSHLASEGRFNNSSESDLELSLQQSLLFEDHVPRDEAALLMHFSIDVDNRAMYEQLENKQRLGQFLKTIRSGVGILTTAMQNGQSVDFLSSLPSAASLPNSPNKIPPPPPPSAPPAPAPVISGRGYED